MVKLLYFTLLSKGKNNAMIITPLRPKGLKFESFPELFFSSMNEIDENKFPKGSKLLLGEQPCF
jgi:hypothetical protein